MSVFHHLKLLGKNRGASAVEYALVGVAIVIVAVLAITGVGDNFETFLGSFGHSLTTTNSQTSTTAASTTSFVNAEDGISGPTGPIHAETVNVNVGWVSGMTIVYAYSDGEIYAVVDPVNSEYLVFSDGFEDTYPESGQISFSTFKNGCSDGGGTGVDDLAGDFTNGGTATVATDGTWVCSGVRPESGSLFSFE